MNPQNLGFIHRFVPAENAKEARTLLLLHGTGGTEEDLLSLGRLLLPGAALLSPRGKILELGRPRFFRRLAEGIFDLKDLAHRTRELAVFVQEAAAAYGFDPKNVIAVGYSNGANIAASLLLQEPGTLAGAVLFHAMVPFEPTALPDLSGIPVFLSAGRTDPIVAPENTKRLAHFLRQSGADVTLDWQDGGHHLSNEEAEAARQWLANRPSGA